MTNDRLQWVLGGLIKEKLNVSEGAFVRRLAGKLADGQEVTSPEEEKIESIFRKKSR